MNSLTVKLVGVVLMMILCACTSKEQINIKSAIDFIEGPALELPPEITLESIEDYQKLVFFIQRQKSSNDDAPIFIASGIYGGVPLSFGLRLSSWRKMNNPYFRSKGIVTYIKTGAESDSFVKFLDKIYETKLNPKQMKAEVEFSAITLDGNPMDLDSGPATLKLFCSSDDETKYAEVYTIIDLNKNRLTINEKHSENRTNVVKALAKKI